MSGSERGGSSTEVWTRYCGTVAKAGGKQRTQTSSCSSGRLLPTRSEVYRARDKKLGRDVAIKVLPDAFAQNKERLERFECEARLLAQLNHPNIATLHGLEEHEARQCLIMELVEGETLAERIAKGPIAIDESISLFIQIAEGLSAAHEKRIIHRDLKPPNIKIGPDGQIKILDFGLAKGYEQEASGSSPSESPTVAAGTATGVILGTPGYMSPEQARGKTVDRRADAWAFGCCLFEALSGRSPFLGETVSDTIAGILEREPPWDALPKNTPVTLEALLRRCLRKEPERRQRDMGDIGVELADARAAHPELAAPAVTGARMFGVSWLLAAALLASVVTGVMVWTLTGRRPETSTTVERFVIQAPLDSEFVVGGNRNQVAISPDGQHLAYVLRRDGTSRLYLRALNEIEPRLVDGTCHFSSSAPLIPGLRPAQLASVELRANDRQVLKPLGNENQVPGLARLDADELHRVVTQRRKPSRSVKPPADRSRATNKRCSAPRDGGGWPPR